MLAAGGLLTFPYISLYKSMRLMDHHNNITGVYDRIVSL